jgi:hypothetical protein
MLASQEAVFLPLNKEQNFFNFAHLIAVISVNIIDPVILKVTKQCYEDLL